MPSNPEEALHWRNGHIPVSVRYADGYFGLGDGLAESRHVFLAGNDLPGRYRPGFHIAELGFGTGLNALAAWQAWRERGEAGSMRFTSFEAHPLAAADMARALAPWPDLADLARPLLAAWAEGRRTLSLDGLELRVIEGDARTTLPHTPLRADAWFLDGFAPARNPELWEPALLAAVAARTAPGGTLATFTAAGVVRRALAAAGLAVERVQGYGAKRHMTRARKPA